MQAYEYKVVPAPRRTAKVKGAKTTEARFAHGLETTMNELGAQGWDYVRADTLPCEERSGLTGRTTTFQNMLVFRRAKPAPEVTVAAPVMVAAPGVPAPVPAPSVVAPAPVMVAAPSVVPPQTPPTAGAPSAGSTTSAAADPKVAAE